ncbi:helix-turn-helix transcriptional regulator [uncultured Sulfitobacter sp.]|uniref:helix-turn-helix transcriptional regulator n=1 Tax=uncultured Sulfitobacter sp. TaxID=191468 RepID=UPI002602991C|nr:helix-turn-helix transcriptional regulator [uncultured Sulfitobacter sp.]
MMLKKFISQSDCNQAEWAKRIDVSASYLSDLLRGKKRPSLDLAFRIERATCGAVPASSWIEVSDKDEGTP